MAFMILTPYLCLIGSTVTKLNHGLSETRALPTGNVVEPTGTTKLSGEDLYKNESSANTSAPGPRLENSRGKKKGKKELKFCSNVSSFHTLCDILV